MSLVYVALIEFWARGRQSVRGGFVIPLSCFVVVEYSGGRRWGVGGRHKGGSRCGLAVEGRWHGGCVVDRGWVAE